MTAKSGRSKAERVLGITCDASGAGAGAVLRPKAGAEAGSPREQGPGPVALLLLGGALLAVWAQHTREEVEVLRTR